MTKLRLFLFLSLIVLPCTAMAQPVIQQVSISGTERVEPATVLTYMNVRKGDPMTQDNVDQAIKNLYRTGLFADVKAEQSGNTLIMTVVENPLINRVAFEGNKRIKDEELAAEVALRSRQVLSRSAVQADVTRIYQLYRRQGRYSVSVDPKIIELDQNRVNLVFEIVEGDVSSIDSIRFVGNKRFSDDQLRDIISTKENRWYRLMSSADNYDSDRLAYDQELLRRFYLSEGYADFQVVSSNAELSEDRKDFYVTLTVDEGERYKIRGVSIDSNLRNFDASVLNDQIGFDKGDWYDASEVESTIEDMTDELGERQYPFVKVSPIIKRNRDSRMIDLVFQISETPRVFVERINIHGNARTRDDVIRREFNFVEGDPFIRSKLAKSEQNVKDLDYFETVEIQTQQGTAPDKAVVDIGVTEKSTGELSLGAGFSTSDGPLADFRIRERNFLGKGQELMFATTIAGERTEFDVSFTEPYFLGRDLSAGVDAFHITRDLQDESSFNQERTGTGLRLGYPLSEKWRQTLRYRIEDNRIEDVPNTASRFILEQEGQRITSAISQRLTYDDRDSKLYPTRGLTAWGETEFAGLGGDAEYISGTLGASYYYPVTERIILNGLGETGAIGSWSDENVAINERFYLGGSTLRGFESAGVGPRDLTTDDALGGNYFYRGSLEAAFPVGLPDELGIKGHAFTDVGSLWHLDDVSGGGVVDENQLRASAGLGLSWRSPFGPLRVDFGFPVVKEDYDEEENFRLNFGTRF